MGPTSPIQAELVGLWKCRGRAGPSWAQVIPYHTLIYAGRASFMPKPLAGLHYLGSYPTLKAEGRVRAKK